MIASAAAQIYYREGGEPYFAELIGDPDLKTSDGELSVPQRERLRSDFERLLAMSLADTLRALDLGATLPAPVTGTRRIVPQPRRNTLFAHYAIVVVDARTLKLIRAITGSMRPRTSHTPTDE